MTEASASNYWISSTALSITLNAMGDADYIQANVASGAMIMCYMRNIDGLGYDAGHNYRRWNLIANPTYFNSTTEKYVYAAIPRKQQENGTALIVFPSERVDIYGKSATEAQLGSEDYYYIFLGGIISPSVVGGVLQNRTWTQRVDTGKLASDEAIAAGGDNTWWIYNAVDDTVTFLKAIVRATFDNIEAKYATVKNLILGGETLTGVANDETPKNSRVDVVTPDYLFGNSDARYVRKDIDDRVSSILTFLNGVHFGDDFEKDLHGAGIYRDEQGSWHIDTDYIHARKKLTAEEVEVMKTSHIKGKVVNSAGGFVISRIEKTAGAWRCYFVQQDSEGRRVYNSMQVNDLALCETFNLIDAGGQLSNHYWHRRVIAVGTDYVDIADNTNVDDYASGSDTPQVGDEVVQLGNLTIPERQSAIIQSAAGEGAPYFKIIKGINSFTLPDPIFLFDKQKFEIRVENPANRGKYIRLQDFLDTMQGRINAVQQQSDKQLVIWFGDVVPTLTTEPANEWADDATKELHEHDIYYNRSYAETGGGRAYSFEKNPDGSFSWHEITDADVLKSLEAAKHAQDTADGKRRMFVRDQPAPPYDKGDQWSNASFEDEYNNDLLVCVRPKAAGEEFSIEDWQSAQHYTTKQFEAEFNVGGKSISAFVKDLRTGLEAVGMHMDGENSSFTVNAKNFKVQTPEGKVAFVASDGTIDASRVRMRCEHGSIYFGEVDGYPNIILTNELGQPQVMLNHRGIVNKYGVDMELINASRYFVSKRDGKAYLGVNIIVRITNRGFQQNTYGGGDIELTATLDDKSHEYITLQLGQQYTDDNKAIIAATTPITLKIGESGEMIYGGLFVIGSTSGGAVVAQKMSYSVRSVYYDMVVTKSYVSELGGNNFSSDSGGNLINPSNGDEPPAVIPAPNMDV